MDAAGIFLATRPDEPFGLSVVEAMAAGAPVMAARGGGHDETVGVAAEPALFGIADLDEGAELLCALASDAVRRDSYGAQLRHIQREKFTIERQVSETFAVYRSLVGTG